MPESLTPGPGIPPHAVPDAEPRGVPWNVRAALSGIGGSVLEGCRSTDQIPALTGLRAIAAWLVWLFHDGLYVEHPGVFTRIFRAGYLGVTIFFVLSGYLIALRCSQTSRLEWSWFANYVRNRFARIYPVYFGITIPSLIIYHASPLCWFTSLTLTGGFLDPPLLIVTPGWSLTVEECFYFSAPLLFLLMRNFVRGFLLPLLAAWGIVLIVTFARPGGPDGLDGFTYVMSTYPGRFLEFLLGAWAAVLQLRGRVRGRSGGLTYGGLAVSLAIGAVLVVTRGDGLVYENKLFTHLVGKLLLPWGIVVFVVGLALERTHLSRLLGHPLLVLCGRGSYVFYLIHMGVIAGVLVKFGVRGALHFVVLNVISIAAFLWFEEPMRKLIRARPRRRPQVLIPALPTMPEPTAAR